MGEEPATLTLKPLVYMHPPALRYNTLYEFPLYEYPWIYEYNVHDCTTYINYLNICW